MADVLLFCCGLLFFATPFLHGAGLFTAQWASSPTCHSIGLYRRCCMVQEYGEKCDNTHLNERVLRLQATAFALLTLAVVFTITNIAKECCKDGEHQFINYMSGFCLTFYLIAGLLSFIGCMHLVSEYSGRFGYSYFLTLASACIDIVLSVGIVIAVTYGELDFDRLCRSERVEPIAVVEAIFTATDIALN